MMIFCPRNTRKARKYSYSCQDDVNTQMTLMLECRLRLLWQAKLALRPVPVSQELQGLERKCRRSGPCPRLGGYFLVPTRRVGMPSRRAAPRVTGNVAYTGRSASSPAFPRSTWERGVLEHLCIKTSATRGNERYNDLPQTPVYDNESWNLGTSVIFLQTASMVFFMPFLDKYPLSR